MQRTPVILLAWGLLLGSGVRALLLSSVLLFCSLVFAPPPVQASTMDDIARFAHVDPEVTDSVTLVEGVAMVERKLEKTMRSAGLEVVNPINELFDPAKHEVEVKRRLSGMLA